MGAESIEADKTEIRVETSDSTIGPAYTAECFIRVYGPLGPLEIESELTLTKTGDGEADLLAEKTKWYHEETEDRQPFKTIDRQHSADPIHSEQQFKEECEFHLRLYKTADEYERVLEGERLGIQNALDTFETPLSKLGERSKPTKAQFEVYILREHYDLQRKWVACALGSSPSNVDNLYRAGREHMADIREFVHSYEDVTTDFITEPPYVE